MKKLGLGIVVLITALSVSSCRTMGEREQGMSRGVTQKNDQRQIKKTRKITTPARRGSRSARKQVNFENLELFISDSLNGEWGKAMSHLSQREKKQIASHPLGFVGMLYNLGLSHTHPSEESLSELFAAVSRVGEKKSLGMSSTWILSQAALALERAGREEQAVALRETLQSHLTSQIAKKIENELRLQALSAQDNPLEREENTFAAEQRRLILEGKPADVVQNVDSRFLHSTRPAFRAELLQLRSFAMQLLRGHFRREFRVLTNLAAQGEGDNSAEMLQDLQERYPQPEFQRVLVAFQKGKLTLDTNEQSAEGMPGFRIPAPPDGTMDLQLTHKRARDSMAAGRFGDAVEILHTIPPGSENSESLTLKNEAIKKHIKQLRKRISRIYLMARRQGDNQTRLHALREAQKLVQFIFEKYPKQSVNHRALKRTRLTINRAIKRVSQGGK